MQLSEAYFYPRLATSVTDPHSFLTTMVDAYL